MNVSILIVGLLALMAIGVPVAFAMGISGVAFLIARADIPLMVIPQRMAGAIESFPLLAVPFFVLAGNLMNSGGITRRLFDFCRVLVGHIRGGLAHVNILASIVFAGMSGSAVADAAGLGQIEIQAMVDDGFDKSYAAAVTTASSAIGPIIPPSVPLVLYGVMTETSIGSLFLAGIVPGLLMGLALMVMVYVQAPTLNYRVRPRASAREIWDAFVKSFFPLLTPIIILGGIFGGIVTPTEAGVLAVLYSIVLGLVYKDVSIKSVWTVLEQSALTIGTILIIVAGAGVFGWLTMMENVPEIIGSAILGLTTNRFAILFLINIVLLALGCIMETTSILLLVVPMLFGIGLQVGIDPVHLGVVTVLNLMLGMNTPPVGIGLFIVSNLTGEPVSKVTKATVPLLIPLFVVLALITYVPELVTWLPGWLLP